MKTLQDEFERLLDIETVLSLETLMSFVADGDEWTCIEHDSCRDI